MTVVYKDRVAQTATTTGTGTYSLSGSVSAFQDFDEVGNGNECYYCARLGADWEVGRGTVTVGSPNTLTRAEILDSSNAGAAVNWGAGTKTVALVTPAALHQRLDVLDVGDVRRFGAIGNGTTDDSVAIQACVNANKGGRITLPFGYSFLGAGITLVGSTYDGTTIDIQGEFKLKPAATSGTNNWNSVYVGIGVQGVDNVHIDGHFNGDRTNQQDREQTIMIGLAGVTNFSSDVLKFREIRGDGVYVSQYNYTSDTDNSEGVRFGEIWGYNSADDGRNLLSVISCDDLSAGLIDSYQIGGTVGSSLMPGGLDIEPNETYQSCKRISIGTVRHYGTGSTGVAIQGKPSDLTVTSDVTIGSVNCIKTTAASIADGIGNTTIAATVFLKIDNVSNVSVGSVNGASLNAWALQGVEVSNSEGVSIGSGRVRHVVTGLFIGRSDNDGTYNGVQRCDINLDVDDVARYGVELGKVTDANLRGSITRPASGIYSSLFAVQTILYTATRVRFSHRIPYDALWTRAYRKDASNPPTLTDCVIQGAWLPGSWASFLTRSDLGIPVYHTPGYTDGYATAVPSSGVHPKGQIIFNADPAAGEPLGWICTVAGTSGTWVPFGGIQSANAYSATNVTTDRAFDANTVVVAELADIVGTLIADLRSSGIIQ